MVLRWTAAGMLNAERSFRRIQGPQTDATARRRAAPTHPPETAADTETVGAAA